MHAPPFTNNMYFFSWLLSENPMFPRSSDRAYTAYVDEYLGQLFDQVRDLQFYTQSEGTGGPIIFIQVLLGILRVAHINL